MSRVFVGMDGVLVDFDGYVAEHGISTEAVKRVAGHYIAMPPMRGSLDFINALLLAGVDVWVATKPPTGNPRAYAEKASWIYQHLPALSKKLILTHNKGMLGDVGDLLIDDEPHKAGCSEFEGEIIKFDPFTDGEWSRCLAAISEHFGIVVQEQKT